MFAFLMRSVALLGTILTLAHSNSPIISGQGDFRYEYQPALLQVPGSLRLCGLAYHNFSSGL